ncbi:MAG: hypothetical protein E6I91_02510 [Chloroflexi bacterium]|nr:MAG: hypothetical protein E6I91_02510 [Chloroflexota bacterium]
MDEYRGELEMALAGAEQEASAAFNKAVVKMDCLIRKRKEWRRFQECYNKGLTLELDKMMSNEEFSSRAGNEPTETPVSENRAQEEVAVSFAEDISNLELDYMDWSCSDLESLAVDLGLSSSIGVLPVELSN